MLLSYDDSGKCNNAFKLLSRNDILKIAYNSIKSKPGNMVRGTDRETLDGMPIQWFNDTSKSLISETYKFRPARRVLIPKPNGKKRPLGISSPCPPPKLAWGEGIGRGVGLSGNHPLISPQAELRGGDRDKVIQQSMRMVLESVLDQKFDTNSHGFRPSRGCHSALSQIRKWTGVP